MKSAKSETGSLKEMRNSNGARGPCPGAELRATTSSSGNRYALRGPSRLFSKPCFCAVSSLVAVLWLTISAPARAQEEFRVDWWSVDGGGGTSADALFSVSGAIGQPDAGAMTDGVFTIAGGFWPVGLESVAPPVVAPAITQQPASQTVAAGATVTFSVVAAGTAPLNYQWQKDGADLAGKTDSTLTLNNVQASEFGDYLVVVSNAAGSVSSQPARLLLTSRPAIGDLLLNPGFESGLANWTTLMGTPALRPADPLPFEGTQYLYGNNTAVFAVSQDVDLVASGVSATNIDAGLLWVDYGGYQAGWGDGDFGVISVQFLNGAMAEVGSDALSSFTSDHQWLGREATVVLPPGTRTIRYTFTGTRESGSNDDAYLDAAFLTVTTNARLDIRTSHAGSQVELCWDTVTNNLYQLQHTSSLTANGWLPLGGMISGDGSRFCTNDTVTSGEARRFYRLVITKSP